MCVHGILFLVNVVLVRVADGIESNNNTANKNDRIEPKKGAHTHTNTQKMKL